MNVHRERAEAKIDRGLYVERIFYQINLNAYRIIAEQMKLVQSFRVLKTTTAVTWCY